MPTTKKPKAKKTKGGGKAKAKPTKRAAKTKKVAKKKRPKAKKRVVKAVSVPVEVEEKKLTPEEEAAFARQPEFDINAAQKAAEEKSSREELDQLIAQESLGDQRIFTTESGEKKVVSDAAPADVAAPPKQQVKPAAEKVYMTNGGSVSVYRRILLWSSVGLCAVVIIFGWVLTIGGSLGLKQVDAEYDEPSRIDELTEEIKNELEDVRDELREANEEDAEANIDDDTLETIVEEISNATSTEEAVGEEGRDIFSPPTSTEEVIEEGIES